MGDAADMILEGVLCQVCGEMIDDGEGVGHPVTCDACLAEEDAEEE